MRMNKHGKIDVKTISEFMVAIILVVILIVVAAVLFPIYINATQRFADTGYPLTELFDSSLGITTIIYVAVVLLIIIGVLFGLLKGAFGSSK